MDLPMAVRNWPTPTATDGFTDKLNSTQQKDGSMHSVTLPQAVQMWPTPTTQEVEHPEAELTETGRRQSRDGTTSHSLGLADAVQMWPTPRSNPAMASLITSEIANDPKRFPNLETVVGRVTEVGNGGRLNPTWVEWLMGFPTGWTDLDA